MENNEIINQTLELEYDSVKNIIKTGDLQEVDNIEKNYPSNIKIQSAIIKRYIEEGKYKKAKFICNKYQFYGVIQSQMATIYMKIGKPEKVIELGELFPDYQPLQSQVVTAYILQEQFDKAIEICKKHYDRTIFKSQLVKIHVLNNDLEEAVALCHKYPDSEPLQSQLMNIYIELNKIEEAIEIGSRFPENELIQSQLLSIYLSIDEYGKALEICNKFSENKIIQTKYKRIMCLKNTRSDKKCQDRLNTIVNSNLCKDYDSCAIFSNDDCISNPILKEIRTKLSDNMITVTDIDLLKEMESEIESNIYKFILVAIYHRLGLMKSALQTLKTIDQEYKKEKAKILNQLSSKKTCFYDLGLYDEIICWDKINISTNNKETVKVKTK